MAKRTKGNVLFSQLSTQQIKTINENQVNLNEIDQLKIMPGQESRLTNENKEKLEMFDNIQNSNVELYTQNEKLTNKIADYLTELSTLREQNQQVVQLSKQIEDLSTTLEQKNNEIDQYLIRISELTFDNARLRASLQNIQTQNQESTQQPIQANISKPIKYQPIQNRSLNGYECWN